MRTWKTHGTWVAWALLAGRAVARHEVAPTEWPLELVINRIIPNSSSVLGNVPLPLSVMKQPHRNLRSGMKPILVFADV